MVIVLFKDLTEKDKSSAVEHLIKSSTPSQDFFLMTTLSIITATLGLLSNNSAVIIGSMLIAPILYPFLSLSLGITMSDSKLISRAFYTILKAWTLGIAVSAIVTWLFSSQYGQMETTEILSRTQVTLPFVVIAFVAGFAGSFALVKPHLNDILPGIAISVALIPPIAASGIGIAILNTKIMSGSILLFTINALGIIFAGIITFSLMNFYVKRSEAEKVVREEDARVERITKKIEREENSSN